MTNPPQQLNQNLTGTKIDNGALELVSVIGLGAYGVVYKALARDGKYYAVKALNKSGLDSRQRSFQRREIALHTLASSHPNIVSLHNVIETSTCIYVVLAYCPDGDLFAQITEKSRYLGQDDLIKDVFLQIVDAVEYCHRLGIYHRDLKPENILCDAAGQRVVLADFGLATAEKTSGDFGCGSTFYMSPECQGGLFQRLGSYSTLHNDIWSLGVILVNLTCGRNPWKQACPSDETFRAYLSNPDFLRSILPISKQCNDLLKRIFALNPAQRISLRDLKAEVKRMERWTMTFEELRYATRATKEAARAWAPAHILDDPSIPDALPPKVPQPQLRQPAPTPKQPKETVFDITDESTVSSVDSLQEWRHHQQQQRALQAQHAKILANKNYASPIIPSPATSPSVSSSCQDQPILAPQNKVARQTPAPNSWTPKVPVNLRSDFSLSDSDESSEDEDMMDFSGRTRPYDTKPRHIQQPLTHPQLQPQQQQQQTPLQHKIHSPSSNFYTPSRQPEQQQRTKNSPPPLTTAPRTPRQLFSSAHRQRKTSIESNSSSSSASSDASWTGLPPTPDSPMFQRKQIVPVQQEKHSTFSFANAKLRLGL